MPYDQYFIDDLKDRAHLVRRLCFAVVLFVGFAANGLAQGPLKAVLVDEHGQLPCDDLLGRLDVYFAELSRDPGSVGLVMISSTKGKKLLAVFRQHLIEAHARDREFVSNQIKFVRTISTENLAVQLWRVPSGVQEPSFENVDMTYILPETLKPMMLGGEYSYGDGICPEVEDAPIFAAFLKGNPGSRGNIVVRDRTIERARRKAAKIRSDFVKKYQISPSRLRFVSRKASVPINYQEPILEYWYLP